ncbi:MAG: hypothetical protein J0M25_12395 [Flavobacteriales bacterium]|nr:hypothetical protein [Flavobacteriales bacterium]
MVILQENDSQFNTIEKDIFTEIDKLIKKAYAEKWGGNKMWTQKIKETLSEMVEKYKYISSSSIKDGGREWLYDLIWFKNDEEGYFSELVLCMESEWYMDWNQIKYDFDKLLISNATHKLMICQAYEDKMDEILDNFQQSINRYQLGNKNERFMISIYNASKSDEHEFIHFVLTRD